MSDPDIPLGVPSRQPRGAGGTPGGLGAFFLGIALVVLGGYLLLSHVQVTTGFSGHWGLPFVSGASGFGPLLIVLMLGVGFLFFDGKSFVGWLLSAGALLAMVGSVIMNLRLWFPPQSLLGTLLMFGSIAAGLGLVVRSLRAYPQR